MAARTRWVSMLSGVTVIGFIGYLLLGLSAFDSLYMTVITITTVSYTHLTLPTIYSV